MAGAGQIDRFDVADGGISMIGMNKNALFSSGCVAALALLGGCLTDGRLAPDQRFVASKVEHQCPAPRPRVAVARFDAGGQDVPAEVGPGLTDLLVAAMTETGCYRVVDSTVLAQFADAGEHAPDLARRAGADLFVVGRVTAFEPDASGAEVGVADGPKLPEWLRTAVVNVASSRISLALRLVDTRTGEVVAASTLTGSAQDVGAAVKENQFGLSLAAYAKTPMGEAMQAAIDQAVTFLLARTPTQTAAYQQADVASPQ
jgi:curli biogenesis system outer membrane secretion channel CsgG